MLDLAAYREWLVYICYNPNLGPLEFLHNSSRPTATFRYSVEPDQNAGFRTRHLNGLSPVGRINEPNSII